MGQDRRRLEAICDSFALPPPSVFNSKGGGASQICMDGALKERMDNSRYFWSNEKLLLKEKIDYILKVSDN